MQHQRSHEIFQDLKRAFKRAFSTGSECGFYAVNYGLLKDRLVDTSDEEELDAGERLNLNDQRLVDAVDELLEVLVVPLRVALDWAAEKCDNPELMMLLRNVHGNELWIWFSMFARDDEDGDEERRSYDGSIHFEVLDTAILAAGSADRHGTGGVRSGAWAKPKKHKPKKVKPKKTRKVKKDAEDD